MYSIEKFTMDNVEVISLPGSASYEYSAPVDEAEEKPEVDSPVTPDPITASCPNCTREA